MNARERRTDYSTMTVADFRDKIRNICTGRPLDAINGASHADPCVVRTEPQPPPERKKQK